MFWASVCPSSGVHKLCIAAYGVQHTTAVPLSSCLAQKCTKYNDLENLNAKAPGLHMCGALVPLHSNSQDHCILCISVLDKRTMGLL
jgi:regulator of replication initiation timing